MNIICLNKKRLCFAIFAVCLLVFALFNIIGYLFDCKYVSVIAAVSQVNKYEVRSQLLMSAMSRVGVCNPKEAAEVWASGLRERSAALQYSVMTAELKTEYARQLETNAPNWVTGVSSPWVQSFKIIKTESPTENLKIIELEFSTATSTGPAGNYKAVLDIAKENSFWRITKISIDDGLIPYTGFNPQG